MDVCVVMVSLYVCVLWVSIELNSKTYIMSIYLSVQHLSYHNSSTVKEAGDIATRVNPY